MSRSIAFFESGSFSFCLLIFLWSTYIQHVSCFLGIRLEKIKKIKQYIYYLSFVPCTVGRWALFNIFTWKAFRYTHLICKLVCIYANWMFCSKPTQAHRKPARRKIYKLYNRVWLNFVILKGFNGAALFTTTYIIQSTNGGHSRAHIVYKPLFMKKRLLATW